MGKQHRLDFFPVSFSSSSSFPSSSPSSSFSSSPFFPFFSPSFPSSSLNCYFKSPLVVQKFLPDESGIFEIRAQPEWRTVGDSSRGEAGRNVQTRKMPGLSCPYRWQNIGNVFIRQHFHDTCRDSSPPPHTHTIPSLLSLISSLKPHPHPNLRKPESLPSLFGL